MKKYPEFHYSDLQHYWNHEQKGKVHDLWNEFLHTVPKQYKEAIQNANYRLFDLDTNKFGTTQFNQIPFRFIIPYEPADLQKKAEQFLSKCIFILNL